MTMQFLSTTPFYIADGQQQKGPLPRHEVEDMLTSGQILPSTLCWTEGMTGWQPVQSLLPPPAVPPPPAAVSEPAPSYNPYAPPQAQLEDVWNRPRITKSYGGLRRLPYLGWSFTSGVVQNLVMLAVGDDTGAFWLLLLGGVILSFWLTGQRLKNMGSNPWWCLLTVVPVANIILGFRCLVNQEGYVETRKLDQSGRTAAWCILGFFAFLFIAGVFLAVSGAK